MSVEQKDVSKVKRTRSAVLSGLIVVGLCGSPSAAAEATTKASSSTKAGSILLPRPTIAVKFTQANEAAARLSVEGLTAQGTQSVWTATWTSGWIKPKRNQVTLALGSCSNGAPLPARLERAYLVEAQARSGRWFKYDIDLEEVVEQEGVAPLQPLGGGTFSFDIASTGPETRTLRFRFTVRGTAMGTQRVDASNAFKVVGGSDARAVAC